MSLQTVALPAHASPLRFDRAAQSGDLGAVSALALDVERGQLAIADARRVRVRDANGDERVVLARGSATALAFARDGSLLAGTENGLHRIDADGAVRSFAPAPGELARAITSLATTDGFVAVGTLGGAFVSVDGDAFIAIASGVPAGAVTSVLLRAASDGAELWLVARGEVFSAQLTRVGDAVRVGPVRRASLPLVAGVDDASGATQLATEARGRRLVVLAGDVVFVENDAGWRVLRPPLPPGAVLTRLVVTRDRVFAGTDRGLLEAPSLAGPFTRATAPAGTAPVLALVATDEAVHVGTPDGLLEAVAGRTAASTDDAGAQLASVRPDLPNDPPVQEVYRAALRWLDLGTGRMRALQRGVDRRGLLPKLSIGLGHESSQRRGWDTDESFVSGDTRRLFDTDRTRGADLSASVALSWDLGEIAYHGEAVDVSKEAREVIELRDDVLDEIAQLYFERRRTLLDHAMLDPSAGLDRERLRLRADELAAGIDAWTGGWFSRHAPPLAADPISPPKPGRSVAP